MPITNGGGKEMKPKAHFNSYLNLK